MSQKLDVQFIQPFIDGTIQTLSVQCQLQATPGIPFTKGMGTAPVLQIDIAGLIGITSATFTGSVTICFPEKTFLKVMGRLLGEEFQTLNKDLEDGAGELINIIFGFAKRVLNAQGYTIQKALPSIIVGHGFSLRTFSKAPIGVLPFQTELGPFQIEVAMEPQQKA